MNASSAALFGNYWFGCNSLAANEAAVCVGLFLLRHRPCCGSIQTIPSVQNLLANALLQRTGRAQRNRTAAVAAGTLLCEWTVVVLLLGVHGLGRLRALLLYLRL